MKRGLAWVRSRKPDLQFRQRSTGMKMEFFGPEGANERMMDITWITGRIALGGAIWTARNMAELAGAVLLAS